MSEQVIGGLSSPDKSSTRIAGRSLKAATSILKSLSSLSTKKSQATEFPSLSQSVQSVQKSVSIVASGKSTFSQLAGESARGMTSDTLLHAPTRESKLSVQETDDPKRKSTISIADSKIGKTSMTRNRATKFMRQYPELFRDDVSINPSYTGLGNFPYNVVCRQRFHKHKSKINGQLNREIKNITMMQSLALDGIRVGRIFTVGFPSSAAVIADFATPAERLRLNRLLYER